MIRPVPQSLLRLFDKGAASYAKFRPEYPPELYQTILQHANLSSCALAADIATGSGQAAKDLSKYFDNVIALDSSKAQLGQAPNLPGVSFQIGHAEDTQLAAESVNLATVAQALHW